MYGAHSVLVLDSCRVHYNISTKRPLFYNAIMQASQKRVGGCI